MIRALLTPLLVLLAPDILRTVEEARTAEARAIGERDEARYLLACEHASCARMSVAAEGDARRIDTLEHEIETLRSEAASASADGAENAHGARVLDLLNDLGRAEIRIGQLERERDELRRRLNERGDDVRRAPQVETVEANRRMRAAEDKARKIAAEIETVRTECQRDVGRMSLALNNEGHAKDMAETTLAGMLKSRDDWRSKAIDAADTVEQLLTQADEVNAGKLLVLTDLAAARVRIRTLEEQIDARADVAPVVEPCAWCLGPIGRCPARLDIAIEDADPPQLALVCRRCWDIPDVYTAEVRARVATRAASCPTRRASADPLAIKCDECAAPVGCDCRPI